MGRAHEQVNLQNERFTIGVKAILIVFLIVAGVAASAFAISWALNLPVGTRTVLEPQYTREPVAWEGAVIRDATTHTWGFRWPPRARVTQVQYSLKNLDSVHGRFIVGMVFDNGELSKDVQRVSVSNWQLRKRQPWYSIPRFGGHPDIESASRRRISLLPTSARL